MNIFVPPQSRWSDVAASGSPGTACLIIEQHQLLYLLCKAGVDSPLSYFLSSTVIVKTPGEDMLLQEHSHLTSGSVPQRGGAGSPNGDTQREEEEEGGREGRASADASVSSLMPQLSAQMMPRRECSYTAR